MGAVESHPDVQRYEGQLPERAGWQAPKVSIAKQDDKYVMGKVGHDGKPDGHKPIRSCDHCPDILFFIGWVISTLVLIVLGLRFGIADTMSVYDDDAGVTAKGKQGVAAIFMLTIIFAIAVSFLWVTMSARLGYYIIQTFIGVGVSALVLVGLIEDFTSYQWYFGIGLILLAGCGFLSWRVIRDCSSFALVTLKVGCEVIKSHPGLEACLFVFLCVAGGLAMLLALTLIGLLFHFRDLEDVGHTSENSAYLIVLIMYLWCSNVLRNVMVCTTAGTTAEWWFEYKLLRPDHHAAKPRGHNPTLEALGRACTFDLPPICYGSLVIAPYETVWSLVASLQQCCLGSLTSPIAMTLEKCAEFYHGYAFVYIGVHGYSLMTAGRKVFSLFVNEGVSVMHSDFVVETLTLWADVTVAALTSCFAIMLVDHGPASWTMGLECPRTLCGIVGLFAGFGIAGVASGVISAANKAVFVLFLENPHVIEDTHEHEASELNQAWKLIGRQHDVMPHHSSSTTLRPEDTDYGLA